MASARDLRAARRSRARVSSCSTISAGSPTGTTAGTTPSQLYRPGRRVCRTRRQTSRCAPSSTATSARSCPIKATSTRPRSQLQRARRVWSGTGERQPVAYVERAARPAWRCAAASTRRGCRCSRRRVAELRRLGIDAYAEFAQALIAEAEAFGGDPFRALEIAQPGACRPTIVSDRLLTRMGGIALARLGAERRRHTRTESFAADRAGAQRRVRHCRDDRCHESSSDGADARSACGSATRSWGD